MRKAYRAILWLYPANYRKIFGAEMMETFERAALDSRSAGSSTFRRFAGREFGGLLRGLCREWIAEMGGSRQLYTTARCEVREIPTCPPTWPYYKTGFDTFWIAWNLRLLTTISRELAAAPMRNG